MSAFPFLNYYFFFKFNFEFIHLYFCLFFLTFLVFVFCYIPKEFLAFLLDCFCYLFWGIGAGLEWSIDESDESQLASSFS